jgi:hypothetical protein
MLARCGASDAPDDDLAVLRAPAIARIAPADEALTGAHIPTLDPASMNDAEIEKALGPGPHCAFRYTDAGDVVLAWDETPESAGKGVVKLNGYLVILGSQTTEGEIILTAGEVRVAIAPDPDSHAEAPYDRRAAEATAVFEVGRKLKAGYRGYYGCAE